MAEAAPLLDVAVGDRPRPRDTWQRRYSGDPYNDRVLYLNTMKLPATVDPSHDVVIEIEWLEDHPPPIMESALYTVKDGDDPYEVTDQERELLKGYSEKTMNIVFRTAYGGDIVLDNVLRLCQCLHEKVGVTVEAPNARLVLRRDASGTQVPVNTQNVYGLRLHFANLHNVRFQNSDKIEFLTLIGNNRPSDQQILAEMPSVVHVCVPHPPEIANEALYERININRRYRDYKMTLLNTDAMKDDECHFHQKAPNSESLRYFVPHYCTATGVYISPTRNTAFQNYHDIGFYHYHSFLSSPPNFCNPHVIDLTVDTEYQDHQYVNSPNLVKLLPYVHAYTSLREFNVHAPGFNIVLAERPATLPFSLREIWVKCNKVLIDTYNHPPVFQANANLQDVLVEVDGKIWDHSIFVANVDSNAQLQKYSVSGGMPVALLQPIYMTAMRNRDLNVVFAIACALKLQQQSGHSYLPPEIWMTIVDFMDARAIKDAESEEEGD